MDKQNIENNLNNEQELPKYWIDRLSDENKALEKGYSKKHSQNIAQPIHIASIADFNEAIRKFASSFLLPKTDVSFYRMMLTYLGIPIGIDIRMSNHPAGKDENWLLTEGNGLANQRLSIFFRGDTKAISKDCDDGVPLIEQGFHYDHLKNEQVLNDIRKSIIGFIKNGSYAEVEQPFIESDEKVAEWLRAKEIEKNNRKVQRKFAGISPEDAQATENNKTDKNESKNMNRKNTIRLTESELKRIITESVKKVLNENYMTVYQSCNMDMKTVLGDIKRQVHEIYSLLSDGYSDNDREKRRKAHKMFHSFINHDMIYTYPNEIASAYKPIIDYYFESNNNTSYGSENGYEPEDWYERNEHGDFDTI